MSSSRSAAADRPSTATTAPLRTAAATTGAAPAASPRCRPSGPLSPRYQKALRRAQQQIETAGKTVEGIITTRTNVMERKLKDIDALEDAEEADEILGLTSAELLADQKDED